MKVLLDTNVVLDLLLKREPWLAEAEVIAGAAADGRIQPHVSATSIDWASQRRVCSAARKR